MQDNGEMLGACGIDCGSCPIRLAQDDPEIAERLAKSFRDQGIISDAAPDMFHCDGCRGELVNHWSPNCRILECCVAQMGFDYCNECSNFPCDMLTEWSEQNEKHEEALNRLKEMLS